MDLGIAGRVAMVAAASKGLGRAISEALAALTKELADQVAPDNILVNAVLPGFHMTDRQIELSEIRAEQQGVTPDEYRATAVKAIPLGRYGRPDELADVVAFLCSERA